MQKIILILALIILAPGAAASELFGLQLGSATPDQLRAAVKQAGASIIRRSDESRPYDTYDSSALFPGSSRLYIGYTADNQQTAFVEYEFIGLQQAVLLSMLSTKYGSPTLRKPRFISDRSYAWEVNGIQVTLWSDWESFRTRLSYIVPEPMARLREGLNGMGADTAFY